MGSGPSVTFLHTNESPGVFGAVVNNIWSFSGPPCSSDRTNQVLLNPIVSYHFGDGWSVGSSSFDLEPQAAIAGRIRRVGAFRDDAFDPEGTGFFVKAGPKPIW
jgi:hypothetical protein